MAIRFAVTGGTWSSTSTWNDGLNLGIPVDDDNVYSNGFTVTVDTGFAVNILSNGAKSLGSKATPNMTSNGAPSGQVISSNNASNAWNSFDGSNNLTGGWQGGSATPWIGYIFTSSVVLTRYNLQQWDIGTYGGGNINAPTSWNFEGSNDGVTWDILHTVSFALVSNTTYLSPVLSNTTSYTRYRIRVLTSNGGSNVAMGEITFYSGDNSITTTAGGNFNFNTSNITANITTMSLSQIVVNSLSAGTITINSPSSLIPTSANALLHTGSANLVLNMVHQQTSLNAGSNLNHQSSGNLTLNTIIQGTTSSAGASNTALSSTGTGNIIVNGNLEGRTSGRGGETIITKTSSGTITVSGNISCVSQTTINSTTITQLNVGGNITNISPSANAQIILGSPTVTVSGNVSNGGTTLFQSVGGSISVGGNVSNTSTGTATISTNFSSINVTGNVSGGTVTTINSSIASNINVNGNVFASSTANGIISSNAGGLVTVGGNLYNVNGRQAVYATRLQLGTGTTLANFFTFGGQDRTLYSLNNFPNLPATSDVEFNTLYGPGSGLTGTMYVPSPSDTRVNVPVAQTVGTATLTAEDLFNAILSGSTNPVAVRLRNVSTVQTTGEQLASYI